MEPTTLHERVAAADPGPSRQGPPAYRPGNPVWDAGYETARAQAAEMADFERRTHHDPRGSDALEWHMHRILAMKPKSPVMPPLPLTEG